MNAAIPPADTDSDAAIEPSPSIAGDSVGRAQITSASMGKSLVGQTLADRYHILNVLGSGAMGVVYRAKHSLLDREVAVKVLKRDSADDDLSRKRFEHEAKSASSLHHNNLIAVHDYGFADDTPFLVMDFLDGESLAALLKREGSLPEERLLRILAQVCAGLSHAHSKGLVHRDLKPSNILLVRGDDGEDVVKILDFGIAKPIAADQDLTQTGQIFGTPLYMSPEQCQGQKLDGRADLDGLGCMIYRILAGKPPFTGDNPITTIVMHVKDAPPPIAEEKLNTAAKLGLSNIAFRCLEKDPVNRFQSADETRAALLQLLNQDAMVNSGQQPVLVAAVASATESTTSSASQQMRLSQSHPVVRSERPKAPLKNDQFRRHMLAMFVLIVLSIGMVCAVINMNTVRHDQPAQPIIATPTTTVAVPIASPPPAVTPVKAAGTKGNPKQSSTANAAIKRTSALRSRTTRPAQTVRQAAPQSSSFKPGKPKKEKRKGSLSRVERRCHSCDKQHTELMFRETRLATSLQACAANGGNPPPNARPVEVIDAPLTKSGT